MNSTDAIPSYMYSWTIVFLSPFTFVFASLLGLLTGSCLSPHFSVAHLPEILFGALGLSLPVTAGIGLAHWIGLPIKGQWIRIFALSSLFFTGLFFLLAYWATNQFMSI